MVKPNEAQFLSVKGSNTLDELAEIISLPTFTELQHQEDPENFSLDLVVSQQLHMYLGDIFNLYRDNPFHNFEHASHVAMSVVKLLSRIVAPALNDGSSAVDEKILHDHTYGITSDPLTQFSCVFSALIHDVDHAGVPNAQLVKEKADVAVHYKNRSVAEQNSVDLAWNLLIEDQFAALRHAIYETDSELHRFRGIVVNSVMATDIVDKELKAVRNLRWDRAFAQLTRDSNPISASNRKATIVIEHMIQASDVAHTMQHWNIYRKWNERSFCECYQAYLDGRADKNPADGWYEGEIGFFDFYIIPLAQKLKNCGVFGVSSDEYLNYAICNRQEWEKRGREVVNEMIESASNKSKKYITL